MSGCGRAATVLAMNSPSAREQLTSSVVMDTNAKVARRRWPAVLAAVLVLAFVVYSVVWFVTRDDDYTAGPVAQAWLDNLAGSGQQVDTSSYDLACIDDAGTDLDPLDITDAEFDLISSLGEPAFDAFAIEVYDRCLTRTQRVDLLTASLLDSEETIEPEVATCLSEALDDLVGEAGGWQPVIEDNEMFFSVVTELMDTRAADCGYELSF